MADSPMTIFQVAGRAMSAQLVRMNTTASNLANAGGVATTPGAAYRSIKPVFRTQFDAASGMSTVNVEKVVTAGEEPTSASIRAIRLCRCCCGGLLDRFLWSAPRPL